MHHELYLRLMVWQGEKVAGLACGGAMLEQSDISCFSQQHLSWQSFGSILSVRGSPLYLRISPISLPTGHYPIMARGVPLSCW